LEKLLIMYQNVKNVHLEHIQMKLARQYVKNVLWDFTLQILDHQNVSNVQLVLIMEQREVHHYYHVLNAQLVKLIH